MKDFKDVFLDFKFENYTLEELSKYINIIRISSNQKLDCLTIHIKSCRLIDKMSLVELEKNIKKTLFYNRIVEIRIIEKFSLPEVYTPKNL